MKELFFRISEEKRNLLLDNSIEEFSNYFYNEASINRIIKATQISKGGLFKYIDSKEDLYLYIFKLELSNLVNFQIGHGDLSDEDFFNRIEEIAKKSIEFYVKNKNVYMLLLRALTDDTSAVYKKVILIRKEFIMQVQNKLLEGIDYEQYNVSKDELLQMYSWITYGINKEFNAENTKLEDILSRLHLVLNAIKYGVIK